MDILKIIIRQQRVRRKKKYSYRKMVNKKNPKLLFTTLSRNKKGGHNN